MNDTRQQYFLIDLTLRPGSNKETVGEPSSPSRSSSHAHFQEAALPTVLILMSPSRIAGAGGDDFPMLEDGVLVLP